MSWTIKSKPANDKTGWKRGQRYCVDQEDNSEYFKTFDPKADARIYGSDTRGQRADGAQTVMVNAGKNPATITNRENKGTSAGYEGSDE
jgi:hypothetical protein